MMMMFDLIHVAKSRLPLNQMSLGNEVIKILELNWAESKLDSRCVYKTKEKASAAVQA